MSSNEGDVVKPSSFKAVYDEGMPVWQRGSEKGRLFIHFDVAFPEPGDLGDKEIAALASLLPPRPQLEVDIETCQEVSVSDIDMEQELRRQRERQMEDEEDEDPRGGRVQCAQQVRSRLTPLHTVACALLTCQRTCAVVMPVVITTRVEPAAPSSAKCACEDASCGTHSFATSLLYLADKVALLYGASHWSVRDAASRAVARPTRSSAAGPENFV